MIKRIVFIILSVLSLQTGTLYAAKTGLDATIKNLGNDSIFVIYVPLVSFEKQNRDLIDTIIAKDGKFHFDNPLKEPIVALLIPKSTNCSPNANFSPVKKAIEMSMKPDSYITLKGEIKNGFLEYEMKGTPFNESISSFRNSNIESFRSVSLLETQMESLIKSNPNDTLLQILYPKYSELVKNIGLKQLSYIQKNNDKELAAYLLLYQDLDTLAYYYPRMTENVRKGDFSTLLNAYVKKQESKKTAEKGSVNLAVGQSAPDFMLKNIKGEDFKLSSIKDKYIVLDFWGSWCSWCIKGIPKMKLYYEKYKNRLEILGVDCGDTEEAWKSAVESNNLPWLHVFNSTESDVTKIYGIKGFPTKIILDKDLKIVANIVGESEEFYNKLDELLGAK